MFLKTKHNNLLLLSILGLFTLYSCSLGNASTKVSPTFSTPASLETTSFIPLVNASQVTPPSTTRASLATTTVKPLISASPFPTPTQTIKQTQTYPTPVFSEELPTLTVLPISAVTPSSLATPFTNPTFYNSLLPGKYLAYLRDCNILIGSSDNQLEEILVANVCSIGAYSISGDGKYMAYSVGESTSSQLLTLDLARNKIVEIKNGQNCAHPSWSPDNSRLAVDQCGYGISLISTRDGSPQSITAWKKEFQFMHFFFPSWSPDGQWIAFAFNQVEVDPLPESGIYVTDVSCLDTPSTCQSMTRGPMLSAIYPTIAWSPDGRYIAVYEGSSLIKIHDLHTNKEYELYQARHLSGMAWSPDGEKIAFSEQDPKNHEYNISLISPEGGAPILYKSNAGSVISWITINPPFQTGNIYAITLAGHDLNLRDSPSVTSTVLRKLRPGDTVTLLEGPVEADGYTWWKMKTSDGLEGWAVEVSVWYEPVSAATPTP